MKKEIYVRDLIINDLLPTNESVLFIDGVHRDRIYEVEDVDLTPVELWRKKVVYIDHGLIDDGMVCMEIYYI